MTIQAAILTVVAKVQVQDRNGPTPQALQDQDLLANTVLHQEVTLHPAVVIQVVQAAEVTLHQAAALRLIQEVVVVVVVVVVEAVVVEVDHIHQEEEDKVNKSLYPHNYNSLIENILSSIKNKA